MSNNNKCPTCGKEMSKDEYIRYLESELQKAQATHTPYIPWTAKPMTFGDGTGPHPLGGPICVNKVNHE